MSLTRRTFVQRGAATAAALLAGGPALLADPLGLPIGFQSYVVRKSIATDFAGTMQGLAAAGLSRRWNSALHMATRDFASLQQYKPEGAAQSMLSGFGLNCISAHWAPTELYDQGGCRASPTRKTSA